MGFDDFQMVLVGFFSIHLSVNVQCCYLNIGYGCKLLSSHPNVGVWCVLR